MRLSAFRNWPIRSKIMIIPVVTFIILVAGIELFLIPHFSEHLLSQKMMATRNSVELAYGVLDNFGRKVRDGSMTLEDAQKLAKDQLKTLRYGGNEYFWINDLTSPVPKMIMHATVPDLEGKLLDDSKFNKATFLQTEIGGPKKILNHKNLFSSFVEVTQATGQGFVKYQWPKPNKDGGVSSELHDKISCVKKYEPWGWIVGSGVYVDDIMKAVSAIRPPIYIALAILTIIMLMLGYSVSSTICKALQRVIKRLKELATGHTDLTQRFTIDRNDETGELSSTFNAFLENQQSIINSIMHIATNVAESATDLNLRATEMVSSSERVANDASNVAVATGEMSTTSCDIASNCVIAVEASRQATSLAQEGSAVVNSTISVMARIARQVQESSATIGSLGEKSDQIGNIIGTIEDIADQTNLLALNAAIEAARAGEQGRGFAVVADEVRALAERTTKATREIAAMIKGIQSETGDAVECMNRGVREVEEGTVEASRSGVTLSQILDQVSEVTGQIHQIATAAEEQSATIDNIGSNIDHIKEDAQISSSYAQKTALVADKLNQLSEELISTVNRFSTIITWSESMSIGVPQFDEQHKQLVAMIQKLNDAMKNGKGNAVIGDILTGLVSYAGSHFAQEEHFLQKHGYPKLSDHKRIHDNFKSKVAELMQDYTDRKVVPAAIMTVLSDWLIGHIMHEDRHYGEFIVKKGLV